MNKRLGASELAEATPSAFVERRISARAVYRHYTNFMRSSGVPDDERLSYEDFVRAAASNGSEARPPIDRWRLIMELGLVPGLVVKFKSNVPLSTTLRGATFVIESINGAGMISVKGQNDSFAPIQIDGSSIKSLNKS